MKPRRPGLLVRLLFATPVLGWMLRDLAEGGEEAIGWFALSLVCMLAVVTLLFGLSGLVTGMLAMAALALGTILLVTRG